MFTASARPRLCLQTGVFINCLQTCLFTSGLEELLRRNRVSPQHWSSMAHWRWVRVRKGARHCRCRACPEPPAGFAGPSGAPPAARPTLGCKQYVFACVCLPFVYCLFMEARGLGDVFTNSAVYKQFVWLFVYEAAYVNTYPWLGYYPLQLADSGPSVG